MPDLPSKEEEGNKPNEDCGGDARHRTVRLDVTLLLHPRIGVERQEEAEERLETKLGDDDFSRNGTVGIDAIYQGNVVRGNDGEVDFCQSG